MLVHKIIKDKLFKVNKIVKRFNKLLIKSKTIEWAFKLFLLNQKEMIRIKFLKIMLLVEITIKTQEIICLKTNFKLKIIKWN